MNVLPRRVQDFLDFLALHAPAWAADPAAIGLTPAQAASFSTLAAAARAAYTARLAADEAARAALLTQQTAFAQARAAAGDLVQVIRAFAQTQPPDAGPSGPDGIFNRALIPPPAIPRPAPPPAKPSGLGVTLIPATGALELRWKANNPPNTTGTSYIVRRREEDGEFAVIAVTGEKRFVDAGFTGGAGGSRGVAYTVQGQRADSAGPVSDIFVVGFGRGAGVAATPQTVAGREGARLAA